jgi:hypothetical protein
MVNTPAEIEKGMVKANIKLQQAIEEIPELVHNKANAERDYEIALSHKILELKTLGNPITIIPKLAAGDKVVSELKFQMNLATELIKIQYAKLKSFDTAINSYQSMHALRRIEYQKANYTG